MKLIPIALLALLLLCAATAVPAQAQEPAPVRTLAEYEQTLREALAAAQRSDRFGLSLAAERLIATQMLQLDDGTQLPVDNRWLAQLLQADEPDLREVRARLSALIDALNLPAPRSSAADLERLRAILAAPPFDTPDLELNWFERVLEALGRLIERLFRPVGGLAASGTIEPLVWIFGLLGVVLLLAVLAFFARALWQQRAAAAALRASDPEARLSASSALHRATSQAQSGDYRSAMRSLYLSALLWLDEHGLLRYDRALTNREYLERVAEQVQLRSQLAPIVETFDAVWYGHSPIDEQTYRTFREQVEGLRRLGLRRRDEAEQREEPA